MRVNDRPSSEEYTLESVYIRVGSESTPPDFGAGLGNLACEVRLDCWECVKSRVRDGGGFGLFIGWIFEFGVKSLF